MALFDLCAILNVTSHKMVKKLHFRMQLTNRAIKVAHCASEKCVGTLNEVPISMGELVVPMDFLVLEETLYDILMDLPSMIRLRACPYYYCMVQKFRYGGDSEILNHEYERYSAHNSEDEFTSPIADEDEHEVQESEEELVLMVNEPEKKTKSSEDDEFLHE